MKVYVPDVPTDLLFLRWWSDLCDSGEVETTLGASAKSPMAFFRWLAPETGRRLVLWDADADGLTYVFSVEPMLSAAFAMLWLRSDQRSSRQAYDTVREGYRAAFAEFHTVLGVTRQEALLRVHEHFGYRIVGELPGIFDGHHAWLVALTRDAFAEKHEGANHG